MKRLHIAIFNVPLPTVINPTLSLVRVLIRRGFRVTHLTAKKYEMAFSEIGANAVSSPWIKMPIDERGEGRVTQDQDCYASDLYDANERMIKIAEERFDRDRPDIVLYEGYAFAGCVVARMYGVEAIRMTPQLDFDEEGFDQLAVPHQDRRSLKERGVTIKNFLSSYGVHRSNAVFGRQEPTIYFYIRELQVGNTSGESLYAGRCAPEKPISGAPTHLQNGPTRILISASTTYLQRRQYYLDGLEAISSPDRSVFIAGGNWIESLAGESLPSGCSIIENVPQAAILPHIDLIIFQAGMTTTMEALYHGCRMILLSSGVQELEWYADNAQSHGLGIHLKGNRVSPEELRSAVSNVLLDVEVEKSVKKLQYAVRRAAGAEETANWLERRKDCVRARDSL